MPISYLPLHDVATSQNTWLPCFAWGGYTPRGVAFNYALRILLPSSPQPY